MYFDSFYIIFRPYIGQMPNEFAGMQNHLAHKLFLTFLYFQTIEMFLYLLIHTPKASAN